MNKKACIVVYIILFLLLIGCTPSITPLSVTISPRLINSPTSSDTDVPLLLVTPTILESIPPQIGTLTSKPFTTPTIDLNSTARPTFEPAKIQAHTPYPTAQCPVEDLNYKIAPDVFTRKGNLDNVSAALDEIKKGASFHQIIQVIKKIDPEHDDMFQLIDVTGDGVPELVLRNLSINIIGCDNGSYKTLLQYGAGYAPIILAVQDVNRDGNPEIVLTYWVGSGGNSVVDILEWDGKRFNSIVQAFPAQTVPYDTRQSRILDWYGSLSNSGSVPIMNAGAKIALEDIDHDGLKELLLTDKGPLSFDTIYNFGPWRGQTVVFKWDGQFYVLSSINLTAPVYRFQAVQDADRLFMLGDYDQALKLYQDVIFSDKLDWWSSDKKVRIMLAAPEKPQALTPDPNDYDLFSAYARYRILLNHLNRGWVSDAATVYKTLIDKIPAGSKGYPFVELAKMLWNEYQQKQDIRQACAPVIQHLRDHPEVLDLIGGSFGEPPYGEQSHDYIPEDLCPFN